MKDYYSILRIKKEASFETIKRSYKRLAVQYHPDKNPGNFHAEEEFKLINEAYQILRDPLKRAKYDLLIKYSYQSYSIPNYSKSEPAPYSSPAYKKPESGRPKYAKGPGYKIDKEYYRIQKIILGIFLILVSMSYALFIINEYRKDMKDQHEKEMVTMAIDSTFTDFNNSIYDRALARIIRLETTHIDRTPFTIIRDSLISSLKERAYLSFSSRDFQQSILLLETVKKYERYLTISTLEKLSEAYLLSNQKEKAIEVFLELLEKDPENIDVHLHIASIYNNKLELPTKAIEYLDRAKGIFVDAQKSQYGEAYNLIMSTKNIPPEYIRMFKMRAEINYLLNNFKLSYADSSWIVFLSPEDITGYQFRILSGIKINRTYNICSDVANLTSLGYSVDSSIALKYCA